MSTTHRGPGPSRRVVIAAVAAATALPLGSAALTGPAQAAPIRTTVTTTNTTTSPTSTTASAVYAAVVGRGSSRSLTLVNRSTGKVVRTLATSRARDYQEPFESVDVAPDGSVWAAVRTLGKNPYDPYSRTLVHYTRGKAVRVLPYVTSVRVSPDGKRLAITVLSPDGNKDGKGTQSLRIATTSGKVLRTLSAVSFPVDKQGVPTVEIGGQNVAGWLTPSTLVVGDGCCDSGDVSIVSALKPSNSMKWPRFFGDHSTTAIGTIGDKTVLVAANRYSGDGRKVPLQIVGMNAVTMTAARPRGKVVISIRDADPSVNEYVDRFVARTKAKPLVISTKRFPYKGTGTVVAAYL